MQRVWYARDAWEAEQVVDALRDAGLDARTVGEGLHMAAGGLPVGVSGPEVVIPQEQSRAAAISVIQKWMEQRGDRPLFPETCVTCGYDLRGCVEPRCPECGFVYRPVPPMWSCAGCGESIEGHFGTCWRCGRERPEGGTSVEVDTRASAEAANEPVHGQIMQSSKTGRRHVPLPTGRSSWNPIAFGVVVALMLAWAVCARAGESDARCYVGPLEVRVVDPAGRGAANVEVGWTGMRWDDRQTPGALRRTRPQRTNADGVYRLASAQECVFPTMVYAFDSAAQTAALVLIRSKEELTRPIRVQLSPAKPVRFEMPLASDWIGARPSQRWIYVYPRDMGEFSGRGLFALLTSRMDAEFWLPPTEYSLLIGGDRAKTIRRVGLRVEASREPTTHRFELHPSPIARMTGQGAPEWRLSEWLDGESRTIAQFRGEPLLLCFVQSENIRESAVGDLAGMLTRFGPGKLRAVIVFEDWSDSLATCEANLWRSHEIGVALPWGPQLADWPVLIARDMPPKAPRIVGELALGETAAIYASENGVSTVLIDADGHVVANDVYDRGRFEGIVAREVAAAKSCALRR